MSTESDRIIQTFHAVKQEGEAMRVLSCIWDMDRGYFEDRKDEWCSVSMFNSIVTGTYSHLSPGTFSLRCDTNVRVLTVWDSIPCGSYQVYQIYYFPAPDWGYKKVAYSHQSGKLTWMYDSGRSYSKSIEDVLLWVGTRDKERLLEIGLTCCEDYEFGSTGGTWLVRDQARCEAAMDRGILADLRFPLLNVEDKFLFLSTGVEPAPSVQTLENSSQNSPVGS